MPRRFQFSVRALLVAMLVVGAFFGGIQWERARRRRENEQAQKAVTEAAKEKLPSVQFDSARKVKEHGREVYEIRGRTSAGKRVEVEVTTE